MVKKFLQIKNGEKLAYIDAGEGKQTIVLVHGNMSSGVHFKPLIERLKSNYRVIAPDMRGFGDSSYIRRFDDLETLSDDLIMLLDALEVKHYFLAGWSTGGAVALKMAAKRRYNVKKVILIESCSFKGYPIYKKDAAGQAILGSYYETKEEIGLDPIQVKPMLDVFESGNIAVMGAVWDQAIYSVNKPSKEDNDLYLSETMKQKNLLDIDWALTRFNMSNTSNGVTDGDKSINDVVCPVLSLWSDTDYVVLEYMVDETVNALKNAKKVVLEKSGHSPLVDCPDKLVKEIKKFI
ncbi:alpha/beta hydrolase [Mycoplasmatota bacterium WC30]